MIRIATIASLPLWAALPCLADVTLVHEGKPTAQIVLPAGAADKVALAAKELNLHVQLMSGATLPVVQQPLAGPPPFSLARPMRRGRHKRSSRHWPSMASLPRQTATG